MSAHSVRRHWQLLWPAGRSRSRTTTMSASPRPNTQSAPPSDRQCISGSGTAAGWAARLCRVLGHEIDNREVATDGPRCRRCHEPFLFEDGRITHTRHVLGCLTRHHTYLRIDRRASHHEYACLRCGHPLLLAVDSDAHPDAVPFRKSLQLGCGTIGHSVHEVTVRDGLTEYACTCGHSFLLAEHGLTRVSHPSRAGCPATD